MFVTTLEMDNFACTKMNARFQKFTACLREGLIHEWKQALLAPPLPLMLLNNVPHTSALQHSSLQHRNNNCISHILVKAQPSTRSTGPWSPTRLGIRLQDLGLPDEYSLGPCGLSPAFTHKLAFTSRNYALLTATDAIVSEPDPRLRRRRRVW